MSPTIMSAPAAVDPLVLSDRIIILAQDAFYAGQRATAECLVALAYTIFDEVSGDV